MSKLTESVRKYAEGNQSITEVQVHVFEFLNATVDEDGLEIQDPMMERDDFIQDFIIELEKHLVGVEPDQAEEVLISKFYEQIEISNSSAT